MTFLKKLILALAAIIGIGSTKVEAKRPIEQNVMQFAVTDFLEAQAAGNVFKITQSTGKELKKLLKTPEIPTSFQLKRQKLQNWFLKWEGSGFKKTAKVATSLATAGLGNIIAAIVAINSKDYNEPTISEQASHAAFSLTALAIQAYIMERAGLNSSEPLTIRDILEIVKDFARKQAHPRPEISAKAIAGLKKLLKAARNNKLTNATQTPSTPEISEESALESLENFFN